MPKIVRQEDARAVLAYLYNDAVAHSREAKKEHNRQKRLSSWLAIKDILDLRRDA